MDTLVFDIEGEYAQFKKPYSPMSPVSFPFPPPTAVLGLLGALAGYAKDEYAERLGWQQVRVGVGLRAPVRVFRAALNLLNTKDGTDSHFRPKAGANTHIQVPCEFLRSPAFRIYAADLPAEVADDLARELSAGRTAYTPSLGLAQCLAEVRWVGRYPARPAAATEWSAATVVPLVEGVRVRYEEGRRYQRLRVPASMGGERVVHRYQEVVVAEDAGPVQGTGGALFEVNGETVAFF